MNLDDLSKDGVPKTCGRERGEVRAGNGEGNDCGRVIDPEFSSQKEGRVSNSEREVS